MSVSCKNCRHAAVSLGEAPCFECLEGSNFAPTVPVAPVPEYTGGSVSYYKIRVENPTSGFQPYDAECNDIIEALGMNYAEGNAFKAIWRRCAAHKGKAKAGYKDGRYNAEKVVFFGQRMVAQEAGK